MNREEYREAFDRISFSPDFCRRTTALLRERLREQEEQKMNFGKTKKLAVLAAASDGLSHRTAADTDTASRQTAAAAWRSRCWQRRSRERTPSSWTRA